MKQIQTPPRGIDAVLVTRSKHTCERSAIRNSEAMWATRKPVS